MTADELRDAVFAYLHVSIGICGHCGKRTCAWRSKYSKLPANVPTEILVSAFDAARNELPNEQS